MRHIIILSICLLSIAACAQTGSPAPLASGAAALHSDLDAPPRPWPHENFDDDADKFMFAIISDLNGGERDGVFSVAVEQLNLLRPEFIISVGDLIDGPSEDADALQAEWDSFDQRAAKAAAPFFHVGGNHDLTGQALRDFWETRYGPRFYHFVYKNALFLVLDTEDNSPERMNEILTARNAAIKVLDGPEPEKARDMEYYKMPERVTGAIGDAQAAYFEKVLAEHRDVRWTFLFMHKPVWKREDDNAFLRIEAALGERPFTLFNGHFHSYSHTERNARDYIILGTTGGGQNAEDPASFDHVTLVTVDDGAPAIANLRLDGILDKAAKIPAGGEAMCFDASRCARQ